MSVTPTLPGADLAELARGFEGTLIGPHDADYDAARALWNGMIDRRPALIVRCANSADVVRAVNLARERGLELAIRGGGHNVAGHASTDGGIVIDLAAMNQVTVAPEERVVRAAGGATIGDLDAATQAYGLVVPMGVVSATGIAGLTLGGGYGWLRNKWGLACDNLIGATVVTADGSLVTTSETDNPELLWGLRGGGGNFGVVTEFVFRAHPLGPNVMFVFVFHDASGDRMAEGVRFYRDFASGAPDEIGTICALGRIPPDEHIFPKEIHGTPFVLYGAMYAGDPEIGRKALAPLRDFGTPLVDFSDVMPYTEAQKIFDEDYPDGLRYYWKSINLERLDEPEIERIVEHTRRMPSPFSTVDLWHVGGAMARGSADDSAFFGRDAAFLLSPEANWESPEDDESNIEWLRAFVREMERFSDGSRYLNFAGFVEEGEALTRAAYGPQYARLVELKRRYDPTNLFRRNANIRVE